MFKKIIVILAVFLGLMLPVTPAYAVTNQVESSRVTDHDGYGDGGYGEGYDEDYGGGGYDDWGGGSDGNSGGRYEGGRGGQDYDGDGDGNRCRNFCFYGIPPPEEGLSPQQAMVPQSLIPPTPEGVRDFVLSMFTAGIEMGRLFAETTITFVENLMFGLA